MPAPADTVEGERQALTLWWTQRLDQMEQDHKERVKLLRTVGEHPSPIFARQVKMFGGLGMSKILVTRILGISIRELETYYGDEYDLGDAEIVGSVASNMIRIATSTTDPAAAKVGMDFLARRGGQLWRPPAQKLEVLDDREKPKNTIDSSKLTYEQRQQLRAMIEHVQSGEPGDPLQPGEEGDAGDSAEELR